MLFLLPDKPGWDAVGRPAAIGLISLLLAMAVLGGCASTASRARAGRAVTSQYNGWTIGITPSAIDRATWRARLQVWPPEVRPQSHGGIDLDFTESASTESAIVQAAIASARRYIDASSPARGSDAGQASEPRAGRVVMSEHNGWTMRIAPSAGAPDMWRARVEVWPPGRTPETYGGIEVSFTEAASDEKAIVESAIRSARRYIDASRTQHQ